MVSEVRPIESGKVTEVDFRGGFSGFDSRAVATADMAHGAGRDIEVAGQYHDYAWQDPGEGAPPRRSRLVTALAALVAIVGFVAVVWFAYQWGLESGYREEVPVVRANAGPIKVKPENPGGLVVPNQDKLVLNHLTAEPPAPRVERLLSAPETPKPLPQVGSAAPVAGAVAGGQTRSGAVTNPAAALGDIAAATGALATTETHAAPDAGESATARDGAAVRIGPPRPRPEDPRGGTRVAAKSAAGTSASGGNAAASGIGAAGGSASGASGDAAATGATRVVAVEKGDFVIQLASVTSSDAANREWSRLQKTFPVLLGDMNLAVQTATVNGTRYHRVQTGPFPSRSTAVDMCLQIKAKEQPCLVQKR